ncbi:nucleoside monophosphate kinase, partial [Candidatus Saccharibacteria bacterium]|nr:nucleoside monophosphate kinase [Candidatus Saccharibacteria bacterium]
MEEKITQIKDWLGTGAINIFGSAFAGKDTIGERLAKLIDAELIVSGDIVRAARDRAQNAAIQEAAKNTDRGGWMAMEEYKQLIAPYLTDEKISGRPLVLSMVGRWLGEEQPVMEALKSGGHDTRAVLLINIPEEEVWRRWETVGDTRQGGRPDDLTREKVLRRLNDFHDKTLHVI